MSQPLKYISWKQIDQIVASLVPVIEVEKYNGIYALPRGGYVFGVMLSHRLKLPLLDKVKKGCLVVDDIADTGKTLLSTTEDVAVLFKRHSCPIDVMIFGEMEQTDDWLVFPWEETKGD